MRKRYDILKPATDRSRRPGRRLPGLRTAALLRRLLAKYRPRSFADAFELLYRLESVERASRQEVRRPREVTPATDGRPGIHLAFSTRVFQRYETILNAPVFHFTPTNTQSAAPDSAVPDGAPATELRVRELLRIIPGMVPRGIETADTTTTGTSHTIRIAEYLSRRTAIYSNTKIENTRLQRITLLHHSMNRATDSSASTNKIDTLPSEPLANRWSDRAPSFQSLREPLELITRRVAIDDAPSREESRRTSPGDGGRTQTNDRVRTTGHAQEKTIVVAKPKASDVADAVREAMRDLSAYEIGSLTEKVARHLERQIRREIDRRGMK